MIIDYLNCLNYLILELVLNMFLFYYFLIFGFWPPLYILHLFDTSSIINQGVTKELDMSLNKECVE